jgi:hypothetical protein
MRKIISNTINGQGDKDGAFEFASLDESNGHLYIRNTPLVASGRSNSLSLKNGVYRIIEGVLYIKATQLFYETVDHFAEKLDKWSLASYIYLMDQEQLDALENPPVLKDIRIKHWLKKDEWIRGYEIPYCGAYSPRTREVEDMKWFKCKLENPFECALSNFILREKDPE